MFWCCTFNCYRLLQLESFPWSKKSNLQLISPWGKLVRKIILWWLYVTVVLCILWRATYPLQRFFFILAYLRLLALSSEIAFCLVCDKFYSVSLKIQQQFILNKSFFFNTNNHHIYSFISVIFLYMLRIYARTEYYHLCKWQNFWSCSNYWLHEWQLLLTYLFLIIGFVY